MLYWPIVICLLLIGGTNYNFVATFNLDVVNFMQHAGQPDSMFGFSVALHQEQQRSWVIVGAPQADTSAIQPYVNHGGAVYKCDISVDNRCQIIPFSSEGNKYNDQLEQVDTKSHQWFGATVASAGIDGPLVACAPRYVYHTMHPRKVERVEPVGTCYIAKNNFQKFQEYSPCRTMFWGYHRQGSCQAGLSAAITKNGERLFVGAPGSYYWQGQVYSINTDIAYLYKPERYGQFGDGLERGQTYSFSLNDPRDKVWSTGESTAVEDDSYLGYSSATGDFNGDGAQGVAVGMPRGGGLLGKVLIFSWNMTNQQNITGEQIGAYFGYSLCVVDVDGDKYDDLIIGAPMHTEPNNEGKYEMGRVYIIYQGRYNKFQTIDTRDGVNSRARFGLSLTSLLDINLDGFGDFAVGAPYDGPSGRGAVYIYHGSAEGPLAKYSQVIFAEDVIGLSLSTFGFSVAGGIDLDGNMYPDMVVGAYEADKAIVFKSRPVAVMEATTTFITDSKLISLDDKNCTIGRDRKQVTCTAINSCLKYNGINLPPNIDIEVSWILDSKKPRNPRMFFLKDEGRNIRNSTMRLYRGKPECRMENVYISDNLKDKLTPLEVEMNYNLRNNLPIQSSLNRRRRSTLEPVLDQNQGTIQRDSINIQKNCGSDNICIPDLRLNIETVDKYLLGSTAPLDVNVSIANHGEDAFEASFYMIIPPGMNLIRRERIDDHKDTPITCTTPTPATNNTLKCDIGNPLPTGKFVKLRVFMKPNRRQGISPSYDFYMEVNSTNPEVDQNIYDNVVKKSVDIWVETDLSIIGKSVQEELHYNVSEFVDIVNATIEDEIGPQVIHMYNIGNNGPSTIEEVEIYIKYPYETLAGDKLMYLIGQPELNGKIKCDAITSNELNVPLNKNLSRISQLERAGALSSSFNKNTQGSKVFSESSASNDKSSSSSSSSNSHSSSSHSSSSSSSSQQSSSAADMRMSDAERRKLEAEKYQESTGDASYTHRYRAGQAEQQTQLDANRNRDRVHDQQSTYSRGGSPTYTYTASKNRSAVQGPDGKFIVSESSTEHYGGANANMRSNLRQEYSQNAGSQNRNTNSGKTNSAGMLKLDDISTEERVSQDISKLNGANFNRGGTTSSQRNTTTGSTGRRRMMSQQDGEPLQPGLITGVTQSDKFQTSSMDLGAINRNNLDDEIRNTDGSISHSASSGGRFGGSGSRHGHTGGFSHSSHSSNSGSFANTNDPEDDYTIDDEYYEEDDTETQNNNQNHQHQSSSGKQSYSSSSSSSSDSQQAQRGTPAGGNQHFQHYQRYKRQAIDFNEIELDNALQCNRTKCQYLRCVAGPIPKNDDTIWIAIRTRLVAKTMYMVAPMVPLNISTMAIARITKLPFIGTPTEMPLKDLELSVTAIPIPEPKPDVVPLWVVVLSACAGVIILLLIIYLLYKCGFFKRNRPTDSQERQPLNRNGAYQGDEHL